MRKAILAVLAVGLAGCATGYQTKGWSGGFSETQLSPDTFMVNFAANAYTTPEQASDFAILRAADKSEALGCDHFAILNGAESSTTGAVTVNTAAYGDNTAVSTGGVFPMVKPNSKLMVRCFKGQPEGVQAFDVAFIQSSIRNKYRMKAYAVTR
ncbi:hypothetical protein J2T07_002738 [Luteibacter jiangsuensis]|uniref:Lipoprotein n=1 Tax=Luteibacter jiangsuensis TaxID=637577 RepID=A0ABT9SZV5_9GAMM|nr:hypothetical protein [Luteibacter jiangsuensis]MDQ0010548.1 hypothetical protein [Luteibacter jiangsuensis]